MAQIILLDDTIWCWRWPYLGDDEHVGTADGQRLPTNIDTMSDGYTELIWWLFYRWCTFSIISVCWMMDDGCANWNAFYVYCGFWGGCNQISREEYGVSAYSELSGLSETLDSSQVIAYWRCYGAAVGRVICYGGSHYLWTRPCCSHYLFGCGNLPARCSLLLNCWSSH